ncbi:hypothetical protein B0H13DRAFT_2364549 [Mycena leptocephala]|nr:hypothetical protein B0H13DRAFT_2364549 [Mycena leptocephala]
MVAQLLADGTLPEKHQGAGAHHDSLLDNPAIHDALQEWVKGTLEVDEGGFLGPMRPAKMRRYINDFLLPHLEINATISESTAVRWLKKMGFNLCHVQKGVYVDGHERKDAVENRNKFMKYLWLQILPFCYQYDEKTLEEIAPVLKPGEKIHYVISHDECCVHAGDMANFEWMREGEQPLRQKSRGRIVHISDFIFEHGGRLVLNPEEIKAQLALPKEPRPPASNTSANPLTAAKDAAAKPAPTTVASTSNPDTAIAPAPARRARKSKQAAAPDDSVPPSSFLL